MMEGVIKLKLYYMSEEAEELDRAGVNYDPHDPENLSPRIGFIRKDQIQAVVSYMDFKDRSAIHLINGDSFIAQGNTRELAGQIFNK